jgi:hypothetical protein
MEATPQELEDLVQLDAQYEGVPTGVFKQGEYILIKREMSTGDDAWIQNHAVKTSGKGKNAEINITVGDVKLATLHRMIRGWNLFATQPDGHGGMKEVPIPYSRDNIQHLRRRLTAFVLAEIDRLNPEDDEGEQKSFLPAVVDASGGNPFSEEKIYRLSS